jgi:uncharacterized membrane protein
LEYFSSYWMELVFQKRWWNYYMMKFNINGRICLEASLLFGVCGVLFVRYVHPFIVRFLNNFSESFIRKANRVVLTIFLLDVALSFKRSLL